MTGSQIEAIQRRVADASFVLIESLPKPAHRVFIHIAGLSVVGAPCIAIWASKDYAGGEIDHAVLHWKPVTG